MAEDEYSHSTDPDQGSPNLYDVLSALLMQSGLCDDQHVVCQLLAVNTVVRSAVHKCLLGRVSITCKPEHSDKLAAWIASNGLLLKTLNLGCNRSLMSYSSKHRSTDIRTQAGRGSATKQQHLIDDAMLAAFSSLANPQECSKSAATAVPAAEHSAQVTPHHRDTSCNPTSHSRTLQLQQFRGALVSPTLLRYLPCTTLSSLTLYWHPTSPEHVTVMSNALQALTGLCKLKIHLPSQGPMQRGSYSQTVADSRGSHTTSNIRTTSHLLLDMLQQPPFIPAASGVASTTCFEMPLQHRIPDSSFLVLPQLRNLSLSGRFNLQTLELLPSQLQQLKLDIYSYRLYDNRQEQAWCLGLSALTHLTLSSCVDGVGALFEGDRLPPNLKQLKVADYASFEPILLSTQLHSLHLAFSKHNICSPLSAEDLPQVAAKLVHLTELKLCYTNCYFLDDSSAAWDRLAPVLKDLRINLASSDPSCLPENVVQQLSLCTGLTRLSICEVGHVEATADGFAALLSKLQQLQRLTLRNVTLWSSDRPGVPDSAAIYSLTVKAAIAGLTNLKQVDLGD